MTAVSNTSEGQALLAELAVGNKSVFAPTNEAFANTSRASNSRAFARRLGASNSQILATTSPNITSNITRATDTLAYHILNNTQDAINTSVLPDHTIARTLLNAVGYSLPGNLSQPVVLARNSSNETGYEIIQFNTNTSVQSSPISAGNLLIYTIDQVLSLPPTIPDVVGQLLPALTGALNQTGFLNPIQSAPGVTLFAPDNEAIVNAQPALGQMTALQLTDVLANHVINGSVAYSPDFFSSNYTSAGGEPFRFSTNLTGTYVSSGNITARILQSDVIASNGVVHVIDAVLLNAVTNVTAASSAFNSATAAAARSTFSFATATPSTTRHHTTKSVTCATSRATSGHHGRFVDIQERHGGAGRC